ncbi:MAG: ABC transporter substrate-binding protein [Rhizobiaceae bacterium]
MNGRFRTVWLALLSVLTLWLLSAVAAGAERLAEPPILAAKVAAGDLPPMAERLPLSPKVIDFAAEGKTVGTYGGRIRMLMGGAKDIRMMTVYGYARLVGFNRDLEIEPDILQDLEVEDGRIFTLHIRPGHRWSDGHPFTAEDFRYWWEDVANNKELSGGGPPQEMLVDGRPPRFEVIDDLTVRYEWHAPNPLFPLSLCGASPLFIFMPAHYLKQFHINYADADRLQALAEENQARNWAALHTRLARQYRPENPDLPTLDPWRNTTAGPSTRFVFERNPYFHRVDPDGRQLPYVDEVVLDIGSADIVPAKTGAGDSDLQARYLRFDNITFLKQAEKHQEFRVHLWRAGVSSQIALYPNLNVADPVWREVVRNVDFRRALSIGIDRHEINQQLYFGLARPGGNTVLPMSKLYDNARDTAWTRYDPDEANRLLDGIGLDRRDDDGFRLLPDGRRAEIIVESAGESTEETDALELIGYHLADIGIKLHTRTLQRDILRRRFLTGETLMSIASGLNVGMAAPDLNPEELAPVSAAQPNWPVWGQYVETGGKAGEPPDLPAAGQLLDLYEKWRGSRDSAVRRSIWKEMLGIYADQVFSIGIAGETIQPVVINSSLRNIPDEGVYSWAPTAYFGIYRPDTFWYGDQDR